MKAILLAGALVALGYIYFRTADFRWVGSAEDVGSVQSADATAAINSGGTDLEEPWHSRSTRDALSPQSDPVITGGDELDATKDASILATRDANDYSWLDKLTPDERRHLLDEVTIEYTALTEEPIARKWAIGDYVVIPSFNGGHQVDAQGRYLPNSMRLVGGEFRLVRLQYDENPAASDRFTLMAEIRRRPLPEQATPQGHLVPQAYSSRENR